MCVCVRAPVCVPLCSACRNHYVLGCTVFSMNEFSVLKVYTLYILENGIYGMGSMFSN